MNSDKVTRNILQAGSLIILLLAGGMIYSLVEGSIPAFKAFGFRFIVSDEWNPRSGEEEYGALPFIAGTILTSVLALLISLPFSFSTSLFLGEIGRAHV